MKKIWIVDDDDEMIHAVQLMVKMLHHETVLFHGARPAGQALLAGQRPDLILLDINMPGVSGLDFLKFLRQHQAYDRIPVIMLSTEAADVTVDNALALGADAYATKPVIVEELQRAIDLAVAARDK